MPATIDTVFVKAPDYTMIFHVFFKGWTKDLSIVFHIFPANSLRYFIEFNSRLARLELIRQKIDQSSVCSKMVKPEVKKGQHEVYLEVHVFNF